MKKLSDVELRQLELHGLPNREGVIVALVKIPFRDGLHPAIVLEPNTTRDQIYRAWAGHVCQYRDRFYAQQIRSELLWPDSLYEQITRRYGEQWTDGKKWGKTSYADIAWETNYYLESLIQAHVNYAGRLPKHNKDGYLEQAKSLLRAFYVKDSDESTVNNILRDAVDNTRTGRGARPFGKLIRNYPITRQRVIHRIREWKKKQRAIGFEAV